jgi:hypothetical protein
VQEDREEVRQVQDLRAQVLQGVAKARTRWQVREENLQQPRLQALFHGKAQVCVSQGLQAQQEEQAQVCQAQVPQELCHEQGHYAVRAQGLQEQAQAPKPQVWQVRV